MSSILAISTMASVVLCLVCVSSGEVDLLFQALLGPNHKSSIYCFSTQHHRFKEEQRLVGSKSGLCV